MTQRRRVTQRLGITHLQLEKAHLNKDRKSTRLNSSHTVISYAVFCLKKKITQCEGREKHAAPRLRPRLPPRPAPEPRSPVQHHRPNARCRDRPPGASASVRQPAVHA